MAELDQQRLILEYAADTRKFEITLFWQRSLFFWGLIAAAFVGYATLSTRPNDLPLVLIACFGVTCSTAWTLGNRGSKYWQEAWEQKVESVQSAVLDDHLFSRIESIKRDRWWPAARFSVSRLTIALSDFTLAIWCVLTLKALPPAAIANWEPYAFVTGTVIYIGAMMVGGRSRIPSS